MYVLSSTFEWYRGLGVAGTTASHGEGRKKLNVAGLRSPLGARSSGPPVPLRYQMDRRSEPGLDQALEAFFSFGIEPMASS